MFLLLATPYSAACSITLSGNPYLLAASLFLFKSSANGGCTKILKGFIPSNFTLNCFPIPKSNFPICLGGVTPLGQMILEIVPVKVPAS